VLFDRLPEPIDLELDLTNRVLYWTDRGDPPRGNTVNRAPVDATPEPNRAPEIVLTHLMEGIGIAPGCSWRSDVRDRFWWLDLFRPARWVRNEECCSMLTRPPNLHFRFEGRVVEGRLGAGKCSRATRFQDQAVRRHGQCHAPGLDHCIELVGNNAERRAIRMQTSRALPCRASVPDVLEDQRSMP
jgi:hypothetical protein